MNVILVDAKNLLYRFGWVHRNLTSGDGTPTGALYGLISALSHLKEKYSDSKFVLVWDGEGARLNSWRSKIYPDYKAHRKSPGELSPETKATLAQIPLLKSFAKMVGVCQIEVKAVEADDLIGLLATICSKKRWQPVVYSTDNDYLQLVTRHVEVLNANAKDGDSATDLIASRYKCHPKDLLKVRAFLGDASDNIPRAVSGVGEVGALRYVQSGADPSKPQFKLLPLHVRTVCERLELCWDALHRNYRLMCIPAAVEDMPMSSGKQERLSSSLIRATSELEDSQPRRKYEEFEALLRWLIDLDMADAVRMRNKLWNLQKAPATSPGFLR